MSLNNKIINSFQSPKFKEKDITVILSIRLMEENHWLLDKLNFLIKWYKPCPIFLIVDFGSEALFSKELKEVCEKNGATYHYVNDQGVFSLSLARNTGFEESETSLLFFTDPDFLMSRNAFSELVKLANKVGLGVDKLQRLTMPAYHVNENESAVFDSEDKLLLKEKILNDWGYKGLSSKIGEVFEFVAPYSNNFLCHRDFFNSVGGYSTEFRGHGSEDFEFMIRSNLLFGNLPLPEDTVEDVYKPNTDSFFEQKSYRGFRRLSELETIPEELHGLRSFHLWHPKNDLKGWYKNNDWKRALFNKIVGKYLTNIPNILQEDYLSRTQKALCIFENHSHTGYFLPLRAAGIQLSILCSSETGLINEEIQNIENKKYDKIFITRLKPIDNACFYPVVKVAELSGVEIVEILEGVLPETLLYRSTFEGSQVSNPPSAIKYQKNKQTIVNSYYDDFLRGKLISKDYDDYNSTYGRLSWLRNTNKNKKKIYIPLQDSKQFDDDSSIRYQQFIANLTETMKDNNNYLFLINRHQLASDDYQGLPKNKNIIFFDKTSNLNALIEHADLMISYSSSENIFAINHQKPFFYLEPSFYLEGYNFGENVESVSAVLDSYNKNNYKGDLSIKSVKNFLYRLIYQHSSYFSVEENLFQFATEDLNSYQRVNVSLLNFGGEHYPLQTLALEKYKFSDQSYLSSKMGMKKRIINEKKLISLIIPLRLSEFVFEGEQRLKRIIETVPIDLYEILIVDYGTSSPYKEALLPFLRYPNVNIHSVEMEEGAPFSIGAARDIGVQHSKTNVVLFHDVDFICSAQMYRRIAAEVEMREMEGVRGNDFFCVPVAFLNQHGSYSFLEEFNTLGSSIFDNYTHQKLLTNSKRTCEFIVYGSSAIVVNRYHYLCVGGHNRDFFGHGAEDYDVLHRLAKHAQKGPRTRDYYTDTKSNLIADYSGFRAFFALYGIDVFAKGISMSHLWHPQRALPDYFQSKRNFTLLKKIMIANDKEGAKPHPLADKKSFDKTLILSAPDSIFVKSIRDAIPAMGTVVFVDENKFETTDEWLTYIREESFTKIGFKNPFGNPYRLELYGKIKDKGISYWIMDRGALPNSWFFDPNGFNAESASYEKYAWNRDLTIDQKHDVTSYIKKVCQDDDTLEKNGQRKGKELLRSELNAGYKKILFIPFQRPSDSVCRYFAGDVESAEGFNEFVQKLVKGIDKTEWLVVGKKHPLEKETPDINNIVFVSEDTHIHDLLELADKVCLLNSGVGLLAAMFGKPVIYAGQAFYGHKGINYAAGSVENAVNLVNSDLSVDSNLVQQFIYHLITEVYSFAETKYREVTGNDGASLMMAEEIKFEEIRGLSKKPIILGKKIVGIGLDEPLFYSFGGRQGITTQNKFKTIISTNVKLSAYQKLALTLFFFISYPFASVRQSKKLRENPYRFFLDSKNSITKKYGKIIGII